MFNLANNIVVLVALTLLIGNGLAMKRCQYKNVSNKKQRPQRQ
jgi:hypothetical protein